MGGGSGSGTLLLEVIFWLVLLDHVRAECLAEGGLGGFVNLLPAGGADFLSVLFDQMGRQHG